MVEKQAETPAILSGLGVLARARSIPGADARALVAEGAILIDVRTPEEFAAGHLASAVNVPVDDLADRLGELGEKERSVVVYCRSGHRSARASRLLKSVGFSKVNDLGAMSNW